MMRKTQKQGQEILFSIDNCQPYQVLSLLVNPRMKVVIQ
jgi:hypothetical protein